VHLGLSYPAKPIFCIIACYSIRLFAVATWLFSCSGVLRILERRYRIQNSVVVYRLVHPCLSTGRDFFNFKVIFRHLQMGPKCILVLNTPPKYATVKVRGRWAYFLNFAAIDFSNKVTPT